MTSRQELIVTDIHPLSEEVVKYRFSSASEQKLKPFHAGQYISLYYEIGDTKTSRPYSIASSPSELEESGYYELIIYIKGEFTSKYLYENLRVGTKIIASEPRGEFSFEMVETKDIIVCLSGGLSITPFISFAKEMTANYPQKEIYLLSGWDSPEDVVYRDELTRLADDYGNFYYQEFIGDFISLETLEDRFNWKDASYFIAGPRLMIKSLRENLSDKGVNPKDIFVEVPGEAKVMLLEPEDDYPQLETTEYELIVDNKSFKMNVNESLLVSLERAGYDIEAFERSGVTNNVLVQLLEGQVFIPEYWDKRSDGMKSDNLINPATAFPLSDTIKITLL